MVHIPTRCHGAAPANSTTLFGSTMDVEHQNIVQNDVFFETSVLTFSYLSNGDSKLTISISHVHKKSLVRRLPRGKPPQPVSLSLTRDSQLTMIKENIFT